MANYLFSTKNLTDINSTFSLTEDKNIIIKKENETFTTKVNKIDFDQDGLIRLDKVIKFKTQVFDATNLLAQSTNSNKTVYSLKHFTIQFLNKIDTNIAKSNRTTIRSIFEIDKDAEKIKSLSKIENDKCSIELKNYYKFEKDVLIGKIDFDPKLTAKRNFGDVVLKYYYPYNGTEFPYELI
jgi:hypothetical protein